MNTGFYISMAGHGGLFLWLVIGGLFSSADDFDEIQFSDVEVISSEEFAALLPSSPTAETDAPRVPTPPTVDDTPRAPDIAETPPQIAAPTPQQQTPPQIEDPVEQIIAPPPKPEPEQPKPEEGTETAAETQDDTATPTPEVAEVIRDTPTPEVEPETPVDDETQEAASDEPDAQVVEEDKPETQAPESAPDDVTEAEVVTSAPNVSKRPTIRPKPPEPKPVQVAKPEEPTDAPTQPTTDSSDAVADALREALEGGADEQAPEVAAPTPQGPPLTGSEKEGFRVAIKECWNVGGLGTDALQTTVVVNFSLDQSGKVIGNQIKLVSGDGATDGANQRAFEAARRAVLRCQKGGYNLPAEKYEQWRDVKVTFRSDGSIR